MALLIVPSIAAGYERVFGLVAVWAHPCHAPQTSHMQWGPHQCWWTMMPLTMCPIWGSLQSPPPAAGMQTVTAQGSGGVPRRFEWQDGSLTVHLPGASPLGHCCPWQTHPQTAADRSGPQWWQSTINNCHLESPIYTNPTPSSRPCWAFQWHHCSNQPAAHGLHEATAGGFPITSASASWHSIPGKQPLPAARESEDPLRPEGTDSITPVPMAILPQTCPQVAIPAGTLSFAQVTSQLPLPKTPQVQWASPCHMASGSLQGWTSQPVGWATSATGENEHVALEQLLANRATIGFCCRELELNAEIEACLNDAQAAHKRRLRCTMQPQPVPYNKLTGTLC